MTSGTLIFFCGKMGSGKSTKAEQVTAERNAVLISEDEWLAALYPTEISSFEDYLHYSKRIRPLVQAHVEKLLRTGTDVAMDFPANTKRQRAWFKQLFTNAEAAYVFYYLQASDELCLQQISQRQKDQPQRAAFDTEAVFNQVNKYFEAPHESEGLIIQDLAPRR